MSQLIYQQSFKVTFPDGEIKEIKCDILQLKKEISKQNISIPYEFMMLVNQKTDKVLDSSEWVKNYQNKLGNETLSEFRLLDMVKVFQERNQLNQQKQNLEKEVQKLQQFNIESEIYQNQLKKQYQLLQEELNEKNKQIIDNQISSSQILDQNLKINQEEKEKFNNHIQIAAEKQKDFEDKIKVCEQKLKQQQEYYASYCSELIKENNNKVSQLEAQVLILNGMLIDIKNEYEKKIQTIQKEYQISQQQLLQQMKDYQDKVKQSEIEANFNQERKNQKIQDLQDLINQLQQSEESLINELNQKNKDYYQKLAQQLKQFRQNADLLMTIDELNLEKQFLNQEIYDSLNQSSIKLKENKKLKRQIKNMNLNIFLDNDFSTNSEFQSIESIQRMMNQSVIIKLDSY